MVVPEAASTSTKYARYEPGNPNHPCACSLTLHYSPFQWPEDDGCFPTLVVAPTRTSSMTLITRGGIVNAGVNRKRDTVNRASNW